MAAASAPPTLTLLSRVWCHLCHDMQAQLEPHAAKLGFAIQVLDVDEDPALEAQWDELVPVLLLNDQEICHYFLDLPALYKACGSIYVSTDDNQAGAEEGV